MGRRHMEVLIETQDVWESLRSHESLSSMPFADQVG